MKVWYITSRFPAPSEVFASLDVRELRASGADVEVLSLRGPHPKVSKMAEERGLEPAWFSHNSLLRSLAGIAFALGHPRVALWSLREIAARLRGRQLWVSLLILPRAWQILARAMRERPDVVHVYWGHYPALVGHLVQRWLPDTAVSISFILYDLETRYPLSRLVAQRAEVVRSVCAYNVPIIEEFADLPPGRVDVIYDGLDLARIDRLASTQAKQPKRVVACGRLVPVKRMDLALEAFARAARSHPEASLVVLGEGPERARLERLARAHGIADRVDFRGHVSHDEVIVEMARAEALLLMSEDERLANVVKEAMACRTVPIVTATPGIEELMEDGVHGFVAGSGDIAGAAAALEGVLGGAAATAHLLEAGRKRIEEDFALDACASRYLSLWRRALSLREPARPVERESVLVSS